jgi:hypothetical protein
VGGSGVGGALLRYVDDARRLDRYGAGRCMDFATSSPEGLGAAIAEEIGREVVYRDVETDGAARAATLIAEVL